MEKQNNKLVKLDFKNEENFLNHLIESKTLPEHIKNKETAFVFLQYGRELGLQPMQALNNLIMIKGKISLPVKLMNGILRSHGIRVQTIKDGLYIYPDGKESYIKIEGQKALDIVTELLFTRKHNDGTVEEERCVFTWSDAVKAGYADKDTYKTMPKAMLYARCYSKGANRIAPDLTNGLYTTEQLIDDFDYDESKIVRDSEGFVSYDDVTEKIKPSSPKEPIEVQVEEVKPE